MPFFLYRLEGSDYVQAKKDIPLAGLNGPFCAAAPRAPSSPEWELSEQELVRFYGVDPANHAVIIDLKPRVSTTVNLYRLKHVWGYTSHNWTPLALELEGLYVDEAPPAGVTAATFKKRFPALDGPGDQIYEFLYVGGTWAFGRVGSVNAPLLWAHVFDSFLKRINRKRKEIDGLPTLG